jgi:hypothetical protein
MPSQQEDDNNSHENDSLQENNDIEISEENNDVVVEANHEGPKHDNGYEHTETPAQLDDADPRIILSTSFVLLLCLLRPVSPPV